MIYQIEIDPCTELDVLVPKDIKSENDFRVVIIELLDGVLKMLGVKMSVDGYEYHEDTGNYSFNIKHSL